jgi:hypothetical protein
MAVITPYPRGLVMDFYEVFEQVIALSAAADG